MENKKLRRFILHALHFILHISRFTLYSSCFTLYVSLFTLYSLLNAYSPGKDAFSFVKIPDSARLSAMNGGTVIWEGRDCWKLNPASLAFKPESDLSFSHNGWYMHTHMETVSYNISRFALNWKSYDFSDTARDASGEILGDFENKYRTLGFSYGFRLRRYTGVGVSYKKLDQKIYNKNYAHTAFNIGFITMPGITSSFGILLSNVGARKKFENEKESLPRQIQAGTLKKMGRFYLSCEVKYNHNERPSYLFGLEFRRQKNLTLRLGSAYQDVFDLSFGLGWQDRHYFVDFAFLPHGTLDYAYITTVGVRF